MLFGHQEGNRSRIGRFLKGIKDGVYRGCQIDLAQSCPLDGIRGDALEIVAELAPSTAAAYGLSVRCSPHGQEETRILYNRSTQQLTVDRQRSSLSPEVHRQVPESHRQVSHAPLRLAPDEPLQLHLFLDRSVIEIFANDRVTFSSRIYPTRPDSLGLRLFAVGGEAQLKTLGVWKMACIWPVAPD